MELISYEGEGRRSILYRNKEGLSKANHHLAICDVTNRQTMIGLAKQVNPKIDLKIATED